MTEYNEFKKLHDKSKKFYSDLSSLYREIKDSLSSADIEIPKDKDVWARTSEQDLECDWFKVKRIKNGFVYTDTCSYDIDAFGWMCLIDMFEDVMLAIKE